MAINGLIQTENAEHNYIVFHTFITTILLLKALEFVCVEINIAIIEIPFDPKILFLL